MCRYFPDCVDGNECLFSHDQSSDYNYTQSESNLFCPNEENCSDQSCVFSEARHMKGRVMCRFQENCNRLYCTFKHVNERKAFLGEGSSNRNEK